MFEASRDDTSWRPSPAANAYAARRPLHSPKGPQPLVQSWPLLRKGIHEMQVHSSSCLSSMVSTLAPWALLMPDVVLQASSSAPSSDSPATLDPANQVRSRRSSRKPPAGSSGRRTAAWWPWHQEVTTEGCCTDSWPGRLKNTPVGRLRQALQPGALQQGGHVQGRSKPLMSVKNPYN